MSRQPHASRLVRSFLAGALALVLATLLPTDVFAAANATIYLTPASGSYQVGSTISVSIRENSNTDQVNAAQADLAYSSNLQYLSVDSSGSNFDVGPSPTIGNGTVSVPRGSTAPLTGDKLLAVVNFKVVATGQASVQMQGTSQVLSYDDASNIAGTRNGASFTVAGSATPSTPTPPPAVTPTPTPAGAKSTASPTTTITTTPKPSGSTTPTSPTAPTTSPSGTAVELSGSTSLETTPTSDKPITKVEYYLGKKLLATVTEAPYKYTLKTEDMRNGNYTLTAKTYYADNTLDATNTSVVVKNPFSAKQVLLQLRHYAWLVVIVLIIVADAIWILFRRRKNRNDAFKPPKDQFTVFGGDNSGSFNNPGAAGPISPASPGSPAPVDTSRPAVSAPTAVIEVGPNANANDGVVPAPSETDTPKVVSGDGGIK